MRKKFDEKMSHEFKVITKYIFEGLTISEMSKKLKYSKSTVSQRISNLFKKYGAKTRLEFVLGVLGDVIEADRIELKKSQQQIEELNEKITTLEKLLKNIAIISHKPDDKAYWLKIAKNWFM